MPVYIVTTARARKVRDTRTRTVKKLRTSSRTRTRLILRRSKLIKRVRKKRFPSIFFSSRVLHARSDALDRAVENDSKLWIGIATSQLPQHFDLHDVQWICIRHSVSNGGAHVFSFEQHLFPGHLYHTRDAPVEFVMELRRESGEGDGNELVHVPHRYGRIRLGENHLNERDGGPEERPFLVHFQEGSLCFVILAFEDAGHRLPNAEPDGQMKASLSPSEDPWNCPQLRDSTGFATASWPGSKLHLADFTNWGAQCKEFVEAACVVDRLAIIVTGLHGQLLHGHPPVFLRGHRRLQCSFNDRRRITV
mmetsp:Transcript_2285/g.3243  ORF Transcript_2285/g.3243 Transcript_2285/m.3243 type:complete len:307 (-) Transcript_2285:2266-3186(-)